ncbi:biotin--[acetyl-CoA-carboxylase] ligase [Cytophagales bacterium LB-30]|uniref:Biotin--[acetyl-CoA-carboxylase] ligase n=1 Tax=Shiella aurantiaca TaxID=3058365 RepID=A0ABT8F317_9BACT|nr:biotin--[acetyl-CoA-carboxylase] ligase [Shiella aurantiaca]MDN4164822.1 biotin--[acetyl-CoA-carboxylase] ligase [Shiella aurantiaca]
MSANFVNFRFIIGNKTSHFYLHKIFTKTLFLGKKLVFLPSCHSTNDIAADFIGQGLASEGMLVYTDHQTQGRGQRGNVWESGVGQNLAFSLIVQPRFLQASEQFHLQKAISLGVYDALSTVCEGVKVKWPNDIYIHDRKVGGILIENSLRNTQVQWTVVGIGINVNQKEFSAPLAASLAYFTGEEYDLFALMEDMVLHIEARYLQLRNGGHEVLSAQFEEVLYWKNEWHEFEAESVFQGQIVGLAPDGRLKIETSEGLRLFAFKEVVFKK